MSAGALAHIKNMAKDYIIEGSEITLTNKKIKDIKSNQVFRKLSNFTLPVVHQKNQS